MSLTDETPRTIQFGAVAAHVAERLSGLLGAEVLAGPPDPQQDPLELLTEDDAVFSAAEVGSTDVIVVILSPEVTDAVEGATGDSWTDCLVEPLERWGREQNQVIGNFCPAVPGHSIGQVLDTGDGAHLEAAGLFMGDAHVGTVAVLLRPSRPGPSTDGLPGGAIGPVDATSMSAASTAPTPITPPGSGTGAEPPWIRALAGVEMSLAVELGRTKLSVAELMALEPGSLIELDRAAGSPVDVVVNGTVIARGEVVVVDEEFAVRLTEIIGLEGI